MFLKLVVLILVCGGSGIGLLSVRQSRLQTAHEMAEARHRVRRLDEQAGEIRALIVSSCTPDRVRRLMRQLEGFDPAIHHPARFELAKETIEAPAHGLPQLQPSAPAHTPNDTMLGIASHDQSTFWVDGEPKAKHEWILEDGTRVVFVED